MSLVRFITWICLSSVISIDKALAENAGWDKYFEENPTEFHDLPLTWETGNAVPDWMGGTYVRNGPARLTFGKDKHFLGSWLDGFAKLHSFKLRGKNQVLFSGKMLESTTYKDSVAAGTLAPQLTLNKFREGTKEWSWWELFKIAKKAATNDPKHLPFDNSNPGIWSLRRDGSNNHVYMATTDYPITTQFDISNLDTIGMLIPSNSPTTSGTHWLYEPGTENSINYRTFMGWRGLTVEVHRYTPAHTDFSSYETVATFPVDDITLLHSFSVTEHHAVFMFYPLFMRMGKAMTSNFHILEATDYREDEDTNVYVVNLKTGAVQKLSSKTLFSYHHINAYEINNGKEIILDMSPSDANGLHDYPKLSNMLNPPQTRTGINGSTTGPHVVTRYHINLQSGVVSASTFPNTINSIYIDRFDFGTINEAYRGKKYCIAYGVSAFDYSRTALVKKNLCDESQDKVRYIEDHYTSEMSFIANPEGTCEDDGVLVTLVFDGKKEQSYLLILDAKTFTKLDSAFLPHNIPWSAHGLHFPEAQF